jgi:hypothetical protein
MAPAEEQPSSSTFNEIVTVIVMTGDQQPSATPTMDRLVPSTLSTRVAPATLEKRINTAFPYPTPYNPAPPASSSQPSKPQVTDCAAELEKVQHQLQTYKNHVRNMSFPLGFFAISFMGFVFYKILRKITVRKEEKKKAARVTRYWIGTKLPADTSGDTEMM